MSRRAYPQTKALLSRNAAYDTLSSGDCRDANLRDRAIGAFPSRMSAISSATRSAAIRRASSMWM